MKGRGTGENPANRFENLEIVFEADEGEPVRFKTKFYRDRSKTVIAYNQSPDVGFDASINPYRGCEHGCIYCYARPTHEYLGLSLGLDFESKIFVKEDAPELLKKELSKDRWQPQVLALSGVTDCYQPVERKLEITRRCLGVLADFRNPCTVVTKNHLVTRDIDLLQELARYKAVSVILSVTTLQKELARKMEPRTSFPLMRLEAIAKLAEAQIPVAVFVAPVIPGLNDHEIPKILQESAQAGAQYAGYTLLRLPHGVKDLFADWLAHEFPERKEKILHRIRETRAGRLNDARFGVRMRGEGFFAEQVKHLFERMCDRYGLSREFPRLHASAFRRRLFSQTPLFPCVS